MSKYNLEIDSTLILKLAELSQLALENHEIEYYCDRVKKILQFMGELKSFEASDLNHTTKTTDLMNLGSVERPDVVYSSKEYWSMKTKISGQYFQVPKVID